MFLELSSLVVLTQACVSCAITYTAVLLDVVHPTHTPSAAPGLCSAHGVLVVGWAPPPPEVRKRGCLLRWRSVKQHLGRVVLSWEGRVCLYAGLGKFLRAGLDRLLWYVWLKYHYGSLFFLQKNKTCHLYRNHWVGIFVVLSVSFPLVGMCYLLQCRQLVDIKFKILNQKLLQTWQKRLCVQAYARVYVWRLWVPNAIYILFRRAFWQFCFI